MLADIAGDGGLEVGDGLEDTAPQAASGQGGEEAFDSVQPGCRGWREMDHPSGMIGEPFQDVGLLVGGVVVGDGMNDFARRNGAFHRLEEGDEFLMGVLGHASADHGSVQRVEGREQRRGSVALVIVRHGPAFAWLQRQTWLGSIERLDLALLVD